MRSGLQPPGDSPRLGGMRSKLATIAVVIATAYIPSTAEARCHTHGCWHRVHIHRVERYIERKIDAITPFGPCFGGKWAVPCGVIDSESDGSWTVLNTWTSGVPCSRRACGPYQMLDKPVPWPVIVKSKYQTLKNKLMHHRKARQLWGEQRAGIACHWC